MRFLVTGSSGHIGSALCRRLEGLGHKVFALPHKYLRTDEKGRINWPCPQNIDFIFFLSGYGNRYDQKESAECLLSNICDPFNLMMFLSKFQYKTFFYFGSSSEYGNREGHMKETDLPKVESVYSATKTAGGYVCQGLAKEQKKDVIIIRPFSVYGPGDYEGHLIPTIVRSFVRKEVLTLDPFPVHDWIYIDDLINGAMRILEKHLDLAGGVVNIGTGKMTTNEEIFRNLALIAESYKDIGGKVRVSGKMREYDKPSWVADNSLLKSLGWYQRTDLLDGLKKTYSYFRKVYKNGN